MSRVIEGQRIQRLSPDAFPTRKQKGPHGEKMTVLQRPGEHVLLEPKLTITSLNRIKNIDPTGHSNESCPDASCPLTACNTPQTGTKARSCCIDCN